MQMIILKKIGSEREEERGKMLAFVVGGCFKIGEA